MLLTKMAIWRHWKRGFPSYLVLPYFFGFSVLAYFLAAVGCSVSGFRYDCHVFFSVVLLFTTGSQASVAGCDKFRLSRVGVGGLWLVHCLSAVGC